jgi:L-amino acid N-acyltransferase YncA
MPRTIRLATGDDAAQIQAIYAPFCTDTPVSFELEPPTVAEMGERIFKTLEQFPWLVWDEGGEALGYVYARPFRERPAYQWSTEATVYIRRDQRRRGLGKKLYSALFRLLVLQGYVNVYAGITLPNPASVGLHETMGFELVGIYKGVGYKHEAWHDVGFWQRPLQPQRLQPASPKNWHELAGTREWEDALDPG